MRLVLARHGEALGAASDRLRPLSSKGRDDVDRVARRLAADGLTVAVVIHSGRLRAEQTAAIWARWVAPGVVLGVDAGLDPDEDPAPIAARLARSGHDTLLVGHLPSLPRLAGVLLRGDGEGMPYASFRPGTAVVLERDGAGRWHRVAHLDP